MSIDGDIVMDTASFKEANLTNSSYVEVFKKLKEKVVTVKFRGKLHEFLIEDHSTLQPLISETLVRCDSCRVICRSWRRVWTITSQPTTLWLVTAFFCRIARKSKSCASNAPIFWCWFMASRRFASTRVVPVLLFSRLFGSDRTLASRCRQLIRDTPPS